MTFEEDLDTILYPYQKWLTETQLGSLRHNVVLLKEEHCLDKQRVKAVIENEIEWWKRSFEHPDDASKVIRQLKSILEELGWEDSK